MSARICTRSFASRFESGSSIRNTCGWRTIARPIATRWRWPPGELPSAAAPGTASGRASSPPRRRAPRSCLRVSLRSRRPKAMFSATRQVRVERVVLEDHRDVALLRARVVDDPAADRDRAVRDLLEARDHPQRRRLAAARRADEDEELAVADVEREVVDGLDAVVVHLVDVRRRQPQPRSRSSRSSCRSRQPPDVEGRAVRGQHGLAALAARVGAVERLQLRAAEQRRAAAARARGRRAREAEQPLAPSSRAGTRSRRRATWA